MAALQPFLDALPPRLELRLEPFLMRSVHLCARPPPRVRRRRGTKAMATAMVRLDQGYGYGVMAVVMAVVMAMVSHGGRQGRRGPGAGVGEVVDPRLWQGAGQAKASAWWWTS